MAAKQLMGMIETLRRATIAVDSGGFTDGQLLERYVQSHEEAALVTLVQRHGPMVWGVCRRILSREEDAEDAFQATLLVLVRKAASVVPREKVANWLYGVARQTALYARATAAKRRRREKQMTAMPEPAAQQQEFWLDLLALLDQELGCLPEKYREVIVLCDLEGKTRKEAARDLRLPEGTVATRLATARTMLGRRLTRHGLALSGGALAAVLSQNVASAGMPNGVASAAIKAATLLAAGQAAPGVISVNAAALAEGVLKTMLLTKLRIATVVFAMVLVLGAGATAFTHQVPGETPEGAQAKEKKESERGTLVAQAAAPGSGPAQKKQPHQQRLLRWALAFDTRDGEEYARQLDALGAFLAVPDRDNQYRVLRDLKHRPAKGEVEDLTRVRRVFWVVNKPESIATLAKALQLRPVPDHIIVLFPEKVEQELVKKELAYRGLSEDDIRETRFKVVRHYTVEVESQERLEDRTGTGEAQPQQDARNAVEDLKGEIGALRQRLERLERRLAALEKRK
jgi:RNA polymerase sigma factor (sigma-70 family)